jgi:hypothetical protein
VKQAAQIEIPRVPAGTLRSFSTETRDIPIELNAEEWEEVKRIFSKKYRPTGRVWLAVEVKLEQR